MPPLPPFTTCTPTCNAYPTPLRATTPPPPSTRRCRPLHAATAALYTPPPPPSPCHPHGPLPLCAITGLTTGCCLYMQRRPCPWPSCTRHAHPGPLGVHIAVARVSPVFTPLTRAHAPPLCSPRVSSPSLAPSAAVPRVSAPIACALASRAPSVAVPHISAPVACTLASWAPSMAMRRDHVTVFASRSCATGWHTRIGRAWETVYTL